MTTKVQKFKQWILENDLADDVQSYLENGGMGQQFTAEHSLDYYTIEVEEDARSYSDVVFKISNADEFFFIKLDSGDDLDMYEVLLTPVTIYEWVKA